MKTGSLVLEAVLFELVVFKGGVVCAVLVLDALAWEVEVLEFVWESWDAMDADVEKVLLSDVIVGYKG